MTAYTADLSATLATVTAIEAPRAGIVGAEITYAPVAPEAFWASDEAADLVLDQLGLVGGEHAVERGTIVADAAGVRSERLKIVRR